MTGSKLAVLIWASTRPERWSETFTSACRMSAADAVVFATGAPLDPGHQKRFSHDKATLLVSKEIGEAADRLIEDGFDHILFVISPVVLAPDALERAKAWIDADPRVATVSFLSNSAGYFSFPYRNTERPVGPPGHDEASLTTLLRKLDPDFGPTPAPVCEGGAVLVGRSAMVTAGGLKSELLYPQLMLSEFSLRASRRGFNSFLDTETFITRPWDTLGHERSVLEDEAARHELYLRHHFFPGLHDFERDRFHSVLTQALDLARAKLNGLRILLDGSALGPQQMGTQLLTTSLCAAIAKDERVHSVALAVPDANRLPAYAEFLRRTDKITIVESDNLRFPGRSDYDVIHRPYQPSQTIPWDRWRDMSKICVITIQDIIAYRNGSYFSDWEEWHRYRSDFHHHVGRSDGIISISHDVVEAMSEEHMPVDRSRVFVVENGVDHLSSEQDAKAPFPLIAKGWMASPFILVLGATYAHKNRDLAIRVWLELRRRGRGIPLILVGANVPHGTTRIEEADLVADDADLLKMPDVSAEERNWLLAHASLVIYATSAEGFGLVPFEAAQMGRPCLHVSFGPLREMIQDEVAPKIFDVGKLADAADALIDDPAARKKSIAQVMSRTNDLTWAACARKTVDAYFELLGKVRR